MSQKRTATKRERVGFALDGTLLSPSSIDWAHQVRVCPNDVGRCREREKEQNGRIEWGGGVSEMHLTFTLLFTWPSYRMAAAPATAAFSAPDLCPEHVDYSVRLLFSCLGFQLLLVTLCVLFLSVVVPLGALRHYAPSTQLRNVIASTGFVMK